LRFYASSCCFILSLRDSSLVQVLHVSLIFEAVPSTTHYNYLPINNSDLQPHSQSRRGTCFYFIPTTTVDHIVRHQRPTRSLSPSHISSTTRPFTRQHEDYTLPIPLFLQHPQLPPTLIFCFSRFNYVK